MKQYLLHYYNYNIWANKKLLQTILQLQDRAEAMRLFSHLITSQDKWFNRMVKQVPDESLTWFGAVYSEDEIEQRWDESTNRWVDFLNTATDEQLQDYIHFTRAADGKAMRVKIQDAIFQLNCHSVHHRAQINKLISAQGIAVPLTDYIFTALEEA
jgi:uncharacterized damage-inducible protein DinB